ncbi:ABC transporter ATP-binding protein [Streptomyces sp. S.PNR 29]|uniref:ABC transporter ATP-binding protein n=1 Tax=Streptomyces sp. S.PNR 29 TaxID=2973805 RepID=UPI0025B256F3|nr:ABC transporter ATP-binding protein [Streptomyces sp. S.PNR 29]MDN0193987.1 ABC transporter ATP-binding protein/permease [Streptomyces sp. S.PNR 29]
MSPLPVASARHVHAYAWRLALRHPRQLAVCVGLYGLATLFGLVAPRLVGVLVGEVGDGVDHVDRITLLIIAAVCVQAVLIRTAMYASAKLGERVLAEMREEFVDAVLALPLPTVERAGTGDLVTRSTRDVDMLSRTVRLAIPDAFTALMTIVLTLGALLLTGPLLTLPCLVAVPVLWAATRWYLARARAGYLRQAASYSALTDGLTETVEGARTVEAFGFGNRRAQRVDDDIAHSYAAERYTLRLRTVYLPISDTAYAMPVVATIIFGGMFYIHGRVTLSAVTAAVLYVQQLLEPVDRLLFWLDELQVGGASMARVLGVSQAVADAQATTPGPDRSARPRSDGRGITVKGVSYAYREGHEVLHGIDLEVVQGERLAIVGPSGAGKSTLGRLLAGIHAPREGVVAVGGKPLVELPLQGLRREVALVTQEQHVFQGTLRDNLIMAAPDARDSDLRAALEAVGAWGWAADVGLDTEVGSGGVELSPAQSQQLALARIILADPHTLVLDEATSLIVPRTARQLERSVAAALDGRTVIAIAHRLHTAHDADRVAVMVDGRIAELGRHDELVRQGGHYAALWHSWHGRGPHG